MFAVRDSLYEHDDDPCSSFIALGAAGFTNRVWGEVTDGGYELELSPGRWRLEFDDGDRPGRSSWGAKAEVQVVEGQFDVRADVEAQDCGGGELPDPGPIRGRVVDKTTGEPIAGAAISDRFRQATTRADGSFELSVDPEAEVTWLAHTSELNVRPPTGWVGRKLDLPDPLPDRVEVALEPAIGLCYRLRWEDGWAPELSMLGIDVLRDGETVTDSPKAGANGRGCAPDIPAGDYEVRAWSRWSRVSVPVTVPTETVELTLPARGALKIRAPELALDFGRGWLKEGVVVELNPLDGADGGPLVRQTTMYDLRDLRNVPPGRWWVTVRAADGRSWSGAAEVEVRKLTTVVVR